MLCYDEKDLDELAELYLETQYITVNICAVGIRGNSILLPQKEYIQTFGEYIDEWKKKGWRII